MTARTMLIQAMAAKTATGSRPAPSAVRPSVIPGAGRGQDQAGRGTGRRGTPQPPWCGVLVPAVGGTAEEADPDLLRRGPVPPGHHRVGELMCDQARQEPDHQRGGGGQVGHRGKPRRYVGQDKGAGQHRQHGQQLGAEGQPHRKARQAETAAGPARARAGPGPLLVLPGERVMLTHISLEPARLADFLSTIACRTSPVIVLCWLR